MHLLLGSSPARGMLKGLCDSCMTHDSFMTMQEEERGSVFNTGHYTRVSGLSLEWENTAELAAFTEFTLYIQSCIMTVEDMFHDGESETRATRFAVAIVTYPVESFRNPRYVTVWNADAAVAYAQDNSGVRFLPDHLDPALCRRVVDGVYNQVLESAFQVSFHSL